MSTTTQFGLKNLTLSSILVWFLATTSMIASVGAAPALAVSSNVPETVADLDPRDAVKPNLPTYETHNDAWKALDASFDKSESLPAAIFVKESNTMITDIKYEPIKDKRSLGKLIKHFFPNAGKEIPGISFNEYQVNSQGTYFAAWTPSSCPYYNQWSTGDVKHDFQTWLTHTKSYSAGFNVNFGAVAALNIGAEISDSETYVRWDSYTVKAGSICQLWVQPLRLWQNQQIRSCHRQSLTDGTKICGGWGAVIHGDFLVQNKTVPNLQCGDAHIDKNYCGA